MYIYYSSDLMMVVRVLEISKFFLYMHVYNVMFYYLC